MNETIASASRTDDAARFGPIWLNPGVSRRNALTYFYAAFFTVGMLAFVSFMQPYLLTENLGIPESEQGTATSLLVLPYEFVFLVMIGPVGALADRIGRRPIYVVGFLWVGAALALMPLAETLWQLALMRGFYAIGTVCITAMMATVLADYPQERSRGMMLAGSGVCNGLGAALLVILLSQVPTLLSNMGYDALLSGRMTYWIGAGLAVLTALVISRGLYAAKRAPAHKRQPLARLVARGFGAARTNPRIGLACLEAFIARGDLVVVSTYLSLWAKQAGLENGLTIEAAIARAGTLAVTVSLAQLLFSPVVGYVLDRVDRLTGMAMAMGLAATAYLLVGFSPDPLALIFLPAAIMLGMGESSAILSGAALIGQEADDEIRGSVVGLFNLCGSIGTLIVGFVGGLLVDLWMPGAPFVFVGCINLLIFALAIRIRLRTGYRAPDYRAAPQPLG